MQNHQALPANLQALVGSTVSGITLVETTGSTNTDLIAAGASLSDLTVLVTDFQSAGKGRGGREWLAPAKSSLFVSVLLKPTAFGPERFSWLPLMTGLAMAKTVRDFGVSNAALKWPNDVLVGQNKISGVLSELLPDLSGVVVGAGLNILQSKDQLPIDAATSLAIETGQQIDRDAVLANYLGHLSALYRNFAEFGADPEASGLRKEVLANCATVGLAVRVILPGDKEEFGTAVDIDETGRLRVKLTSSQETIAVAAADIVHLRHNSL